MFDVSSKYVRIFFYKWVNISVFWTIFVSAGLYPITKFSFSLFPSLSFLFKVQSNDYKKLNEFVSNSNILASVCYFSRSLYFLCFPLSSKLNHLKDWNNFLKLFARYSFSSVCGFLFDISLSIPHNFYRFRIYVLKKHFFCILYIAFGICKTQLTTPIKRHSNGSVLIGWLLVAWGQ